MTKGSESVADNSEQSSSEQQVSCIIKGLKIKPGVQAPEFVDEEGNQGLWFLLPGDDVNIADLHLVNNSEGLMVVVQQGEGYSLAPLGDVFIVTHGQDGLEPVNSDQYFM